MYIDPRPASSHARPRPPPPPSAAAAARRGSLPSNGGLRETHPSSNERQAGTTRLTTFSRCHSPALALTLTRFHPRTVESIPSSSSRDLIARRRWHGWLQMKPIPIVASTRFMVRSCTVTGHGESGTATV